MPSRTDVLVVGAGGHALVCVETLRASGHSIAGCVARGAQPAADLDRVGVEIVGSDEDLDNLIVGGLERTFVAIGDNRARESLTQRVLESGGSLVTAVSPSAVLSPTATVGAGSLVMPGAILTSQVSVGAGAIVNTAAVVEHESSIGQFAHIAPGTALAGRVRVGRGALVGIGACVLPGLSIGSWAVVGAGAVVTADVPDGATVVGVPARPSHLQT